MIRLNRIAKGYEEAGALHRLVNLFSFVDSDTFLTKSGDVGVVLRVRGVDHECLDPDQLDHIGRRFEATLKVFDERFRLYQWQQLTWRTQAKLPNRVCTVLLTICLSASCEIIKAEGGVVVSLCGVGIDNLTIHNDGFATLQEFGELCAGNGLRRDRSKEIVLPWRNGMPSSRFVCCQQPSGLQSVFSDVHSDVAPNNLSWGLSIVREVTVPYDPTAAKLFVDRATRFSKPEIRTLIPFKVFTSYFDGFDGGGSRLHSGFRVRLGVIGLYPELTSLYFGFGKCILHGTGLLSYFRESFSQKEVLVRQSYEGDNGGTCQDAVKPKLSSAILVALLVMSTLLFGLLFFFSLGIGVKQTSTVRFVGHFVFSFLCFVLAIYFGVCAALILWPLL